MATPNYGYEKRQKELARKQKKEEKLRAKAERRSTGGMDEQADTVAETAGGVSGDAPATPGNIQDADR